MSRLMLFAVMVFSLGLGFASDKFRPGAIEMGGNGMFEIAMPENSDDYYMLSLAPDIDFYCLSSGFHIGPLFNYSVNWNDNYTSNYLAFGVDLGYTLPLESAVVPYFGASLGRISSSFNYDSDFGMDDSDDAHGIYLPIYLGIKFEIGNGFFLNLQPTYTISELERQLNTLDVRVGFSGLLGKSH